MAVAEGQSYGWYLICPFCKKHKPLQSNVCDNCGATVKVVWETDQPISPELVMVSK